MISRPKSFLKVYTRPLFICIRPSGAGPYKGCSPSGCSPTWGGAPSGHRPCALRRASPCGVHSYTGKRGFAPLTCVGPAAPLGPQAHVRAGPEGPCPYTHSCGPKGHTSVYVRAPAARRAAGARIHARCPKGTGHVRGRAPKGPGPHTAGPRRGPAVCSAQLPGPKGRAAVHVQPWAAEGGPRLHTQVGRRRRPTCVRAHLQPGEAGLQMCSPACAARRSRAAHAGGQHPPAYKSPAKNTRAKGSRQVKTLRASRAQRDRGIARHSGARYAGPTCDQQVGPGPVAGALVGCGPTARTLLGSGALWAPGWVRGRRPRTYSRSGSL